MSTVLADLARNLDHLEHAHVCLHGADRELVICRSLLLGLACTFVLFNARDQSVHFWLGAFHDPKLDRGTRGPILSICEVGLL